jgi:hypothetical protein
MLIRKTNIGDLLLSGTIDLRPSEVALSVTIDSVIQSNHMIVEREQNLFLFFGRKSIVPDSNKSPMFVFLMSIHRRKDWRFEK